MVTALLFANVIAATGRDFFDFGIVPMAKIREPTIAEAIHISEPSPCIQVLRRGYSNRVTTTRDAGPDWQNASRAQILVINSRRRSLAFSSNRDLS